MLREQQIERLKSESFDILVIGGGATGAGIALDAATRDLKVGLVERDDFACGASSRSTKLIHGGVRYLEQAVWKLDLQQYNLVKDALKERATLIKLAPHLSHPIALVTPLYSWFGVPYFRMGLMMYDWLAGKQNLSGSRYLSCKAALKNFPMLKAKGLKGGVLYYDGQFDDARMNVCIALSALEDGAAVANHLEITKLLKENDRLCGAEVHDTLSGESFTIRSKCIINATGPFSDQIRRLDDPKIKPMLKTSSGIHIVLDKRFSPPATGLLIPKTEDGRVIFLLPWLGHTLVGTTDNPAKLERNPIASKKDVDYILRHIKKYFDMPVSRDDILATWSGLRPLVSDPKASDTAKLSRDHVVNLSSSGLLTVTGGKWTTYRKMALDAVNHAITSAGLSPKKESQTENRLIRGAKGYNGKLPLRLSQEFSLDQDIAIHLAKSYGSKALEVAAIAKDGYQQRLAPNHPYLTAEVVYGIQEEMACNAVDILARRTRLTFLDIAAAKQALPKVLNILGSFLNWDDQKSKQEEANFYHYLEHSPNAKEKNSDKKSA